MKPRAGTKAFTVLAELRRRRGRGLTAMDGFALGDPHICGTIFALRRAGHAIRGQWCKGQSRHGRATRFIRYTLNPT